MISKEAWETYCKQVSYLAGSASTVFKKMLNTFDGWYDFKPDELRSMLIMTMRDLLYTYGDPAAVLAADFMARNSPGIIKFIDPQNPILNAFAIMRSCAKRGTIQWFRMDDAEFKKEFDFSLIVEA
jgi:hypothetical protein